MIRDSLRPKLADEYEATLDAYSRRGPGEKLVVDFVRSPFEVDSAPTLEQLEDALADIPPIGRGYNPAQALQAVGAASSATSVFLPSQAQLVVGMTDFMVERAKDEVAFGFILTLKEKVQDNPWVEHGMPRSHSLMQRIETETFQTLMPTLRAAFVEDLNMLPRRVADGEFRKVVGLTRPEDVMYVQGVAVAYSRGLEIRRGTPPAVALSNLLELRRTEMEDATARRTLQLVGLLAREYAFTGGAPLVEEITRPDRASLRRYFVAFAAHDIASLDSLVGTNRKPFLQHLSARETDAILLINQLHSIRDVLGGLASSGPRSTSAEEGDRTLAATGSVLAVLQTGVRFVPAGSAAGQPATAFRRFLDDAVLLHGALAQRDYGTVVTWLVRQPELRFCRPRPASRPASGANGTQSTDTTKIRRRMEADSASECNAEMKYLSLAASLAAARSSDDVTVALRTASAPVGSYRAKRNQEPSGSHSSRWGPRSVSILGYVGGVYGREAPSDRLARWSDASHAGIALPVGVEFSWGVPNGAISLFAPVLDLGTVATVRWGEDDDPPGATTLSGGAEPGFEQVFAPGLFLMVNATRHLPISVGFGIQRMNDLRERTTAGDTDEVDVTRTTLLLGVDATLFNFRF